ncbi:MAG: hypothetical protein IJM09_01870, partial [Neisseriaceae bacterium]|nr:hypothetical protein [Neisseriaceae bacterium]
REKARQEAAQKAKAEATARERVRQEALAREKAKQEAKEERDYQERMADKYRRQAQEDKLFELELEAKREELAAKKGNRSHEDRMRELQLEEERAMSAARSKKADKFAKESLKDRHASRDSIYAENEVKRSEKEINKGMGKMLGNSKLNDDVYLVNEQGVESIETRGKVSIAKIISLTLIVLALIAGGLFYLLSNQKKQQQNPPTNP